jgi:hypothetical protein
LNFKTLSKDHHSRFQQAAGYARDAANMYPIYAELDKGTTKNAYNWALSDWFKPPVIHRIERAEGRIRVQASDNVKVTRVEVRVVNKAGYVLELGEASQIDTKWWEYASSAEGTIEVTARDLAENKTKAVL